jgi:DnaJ-class molecular chaperone
MKPVDTRDYYAILEIPRTATDEQIKEAYRKLAKKYHPDVSPGDADKMKDINVAYETLSDPERKRTYDNPSPFIGGNPFEDMFRGHTAGFPFHFAFGTNGNIRFEGSRFNFHQQRILNANAVMSLKEMLLGNPNFECNSPTGRVKFALPRKTMPGQVISMKISSDANSETLLKVTMHLRLPDVLTEEQQKKIDELGL